MISRAHNTPCCAVASATRTSVADATSLAWLGSRRETIEESSSQLRPISKRDEGRGEFRRDLGAGREPEEGRAAMGAKCGWEAESPAAQLGSLAPNETGPTPARARSR